MKVAIGACRLNLKLKKFFLCVLEGMEPNAQRLLEDNDIEYADLRAWTVRNG